MSRKKGSIDIIVPAYNESEVLYIFMKEMMKVIEQITDYQFELLFVNDGSTDDTLEILDNLSKQYPIVSYISLSRNFGKEAAMTAGFDCSTGDAVAIFDADLQDPPNLLINFIKNWEEGYDVVYAKRTKRDGESIVKKATASLFYSLIQKISKTSIPENTGDCRLMSRRVVDSLNDLREGHRFMKGLFAWVGYPSIAVEYRRSPRAAGKTKFNYWKLLNFAIEGITSFTSAPLRIATYVGSLTALFAFLFGVWIIIKSIIFGEAVQGYPTLMITILFLGGMQMLFTGILGEYLGRIFGETKRRPLYLIERHVQSKNFNRK
jgi:glycosyltransferase involved in cell wall biosynthesis